MARRTADRALFVDNGGGRVDERSGGHDIDLIVGNVRLGHSVVGDGYPECRAVHDPLGRHRVRPGGQPQPVHAEGEAGGGQPHLGILKTASNLPEHSVIGNKTVTESDFTVAARGAVIECRHPAAHLEPRVVLINQEHRRATRGRSDADGERRSVGTGGEVLRAIDLPATGDLLRDRRQHRGIRSRTW